VCGNDGTHSVVCLICEETIVKDCTASEKVYNEKKEVFEHKCECGYIVYTDYLTVLYEGTEVMNSMVKVNYGTTECFQLVVSQVEATDNEVAHTHYITKPGSYNSSNATDWDKDNDIDDIDKLYTGTDGAHSRPYFTLYSNANGSVETGRIWL
jgi:hypothetical protein